jgi:hypothetical protein
MRVISSRKPYHVYEIKTSNCGESWIGQREVKDALEGLELYGDDISSFTVLCPINDVADDVRELIWNKGFELGLPTACYARNECDKVVRMLQLSDGELSDLISTLIHRTRIEREVT